MPDSSSSLTVMNPGQTSDALRVKLRQVGSRLSDEQIATAWSHTEKARVSFSSAAVALGVMLLAKKEAVGHGKWLPWCEKFGGKLAQAVKGQMGTAVPISAEVTRRSLSKYAFVGEHFLADLEQGAFTGEIPDHQPKLKGVSPDDVLALDKLPAKSRKQVFARIESFVGGRSLRTMLLDFRRAENAADQEEAAHAAELARKKAGKDKGATPTPADAAAAQLEFYQDMLRPIGEIETLFDTKSFVEKTDKAFWLGIAQKLTAQAERARKMAEEIAS